MAAVAPIIGVIGSVAGALMQMGNQPEPPQPPQPVAPPPPPPLQELNPEKTIDPSVAIDQDAAKQRMLKRRRAAQTPGLSLLAGQDNTQQKTGSV